MACRGKNGARFNKLLNGDHSDYGSRSEADLALFNDLAYWLDKDFGSMVEIAEKSGLRREKWYETHNSKGQTYLQMTIQKAIDGTKSTFQETDAYKSYLKKRNDVLNPPKKNDTPFAYATFKQMWETKYKVIPIIQGMFNKNESVVIDAPGGVGKSQFVTYLAIMLSVAQKSHLLFDKFEIPEKRATLIVQSENGPATYRVNPFFMEIFSS
jgi:RecA-family ATPase